MTTFQNSLQYKHSKTNGKIHRCKRDHRTEIKANDWSKYNYASSTICEDSFKDSLSTIPVIDWDRWTIEDFIETFDNQSKPCLIRGGVNDWPAHQNWELSALKTKYKRASFKVGEDDSGRKIRMRLKYFDDYLNVQQDDSPLYLFESAIESSALTKSLLDDFNTPPCFPFDFMSVLGDHHRPPHRWFLIGPKRSGTTVHQDPLGTSAWNTLIKGHKRWILFPPEVPKAIVKGRGLISKDEDDEAIMYFDFILKRIFEKYPTTPFLEGIQYPGTTIFIPPKWWHAVLNLDDTVAVTQNFVSYSNFDLAWTETRRSRKKLSSKWLRRLHRFHPDLGERAVWLNNRDNWVMPGCPIPPEMMGKYIFIISIICYYIYSIYHIYIYIYIYIYMLLYLYIYR
eukprot:GHVL01040020.1.p1 GENE.GHVL01040020.1~~GHVL01040020.1.p1  ORF type:complete len:396 (-),score=80.29 GHVL01040020.1:292-1479(-)